MWQVLSTRARKDVKVADIKVQVCLYAFDCLYLNGQVLVDRPLTERREALYSAIQEKPGELFYATAKVHCCPLGPVPSPCIPLLLLLDSSAFCCNCLMSLSLLLHLPVCFIRCSGCSSSSAGHKPCHSCCDLLSRVFQMDAHMRWTNTGLYYRSLLLVVQTLHIPTAKTGTLS